MDQTIDVLIVEPGKEPRPATAEDTLEAFEQIVGGSAELGCYPAQQVMLICNEYGKNMGLPPNRVNPANPPSYIYGPFLLCSYEGVHFTSLSPAQQSQFQAHFALPSTDGQRGK